MKKAICMVLCAMMIIAGSFGLAGCGKKEPEASVDGWGFSQYSQATPTSTVTWENYRKIMHGMTIEEVEEIFGEGYDGGDDEPERGFYYLEWKGFNGEWIKVQFFNGKVESVSKENLSNE